ncbi:HNH endonuclease [Corynebacterium diphtheriae]
MAWSRVGDNIATHPLMSRLLTSCEFNHALKNEAFGALVQLTTVSAAHLTDYIVEYGLMAQVAPGREKQLIDVLVDAGMLFRDEEDGRKVLRIVDDNELLHNRSRDEVEIDRRRSADKRNPELIPAVRYRDGDQCRWCGRTVDWRDRKGGRAATIDSLNEHRNSTVDTLVVACKTCNSKRRAGEELRLMPIPTREKVYYTDHTIDWINRSEWAQHEGIHLEPRQTRLDIGQQITTPAAPSEQQVGQAAAPLEAAARAHRAAPDVEAPFVSDPLDEAPDWVQQSLVNDHGQAAAPSMAAAPREHDHAPAAPSEQQQVGQAAAPLEAAARAHRAAPGVEAPPHNHVDNETVKPSTDLEQITDRWGDGSRSLGTGRDGNGQAGTVANRRRRRRGRRGGGRNKAHG